MEKPTIDDALEFIRHVKQVFLHLNEGENKYLQFGSALDNFNHRRLSVAGLAATVESLFEGRENLLSGFKNFLPKQQQETRRVIRLGLRNNRYSNHESQRQGCHEFLEKVRARFDSDRGVYNSFLEMMIKYKGGGLAINQVCEKIFSLFIGHADLVYEFERFFNDRDYKTRKEVEKTRVFTIDDYMNEMEVVMWNLRTSIRGLEEALELLKLVPSASVEDPFRGLSFRCFKRFYGEFGLEKIEALKNSPKKVFPVILTRLKQKEQELLRFRSDAHDFLVEIRQMHCNARKRKAPMMVDDDFLVEIRQMHCNARKKKAPMMVDDDFLVEIRQMHCNARKRKAPVMVDE